ATPCARLDPHPFPTRRSSDLENCLAKWRINHPRQADKFAPNAWISVPARNVGHSALHPAQTLSSVFGRLACHATKRTNNRSNQRSEEHTSELQSRENLVCRLL